MDKRIQKIKLFREYMLDQIRDLSTEQLNVIPAGFNNNIIWNLAHMTCAQQGLCYTRSGRQAIIDQMFITPFLTNSKPERTITQNEVDEIKSLFTGTIDQLQIDYDKDLFSNYTASPNILRVYGVELQNIEDALEFILYHDGVHSGSIMTLKKLVTINPINK